GDPQLRRHRIDVDLGAHRDHAEVIGPGDDRGDDDHRERRPLIWTGQVGLAADVGEDLADAAADLDAADFARRWTAGVGGLFRAGPARRLGAGDGAVGALAEAGDLRREPRRRRHRDAAELLVVIAALQPHRERRVGAAGVVHRAGFHRRVEATAAEVTDAG